MNTMVPCPNQDADAVTFIIVLALIVSGMLARFVTDRGLLKDAFP